MQLLTTDTSLLQQLCDVPIFDHTALAFQSQVQTHVPVREATDDVGPTWIPPGSWWTSPDACSSATDNPRLTVLKP